MTRKKSDPNAKKIASQIQDRFHKAGPMRHRNSKRQAQQERRLELNNEVEDEKTN